MKPATLNIARLVKLRYLDIVPLLDQICELNGRLVIGIVVEDFLLHGE